MLSILSTKRLNIVKNITECEDFVSAVSQIVLMCFQMFDKPVQYFTGSTNLMYVTAKTNVSKLKKHTLLMFVILRNNTDVCLELLHLLT